MDVHNQRAAHTSSSRPSSSHRNNSVHSDDRKWNSDWRVQDTESPVFNPKISQMKCTGIRYTDRREAPVDLVLLFLILVEEIEVADQELINRSDTGWLMVADRINIFYSCPRHGQESKRSIFIQILQLSSH